MFNIYNVIDVVENVINVVDVAGGPARGPIQERVREDPFLLHDRAFKSRYRFSKEGVRHLTDLLRPQLVRDQRGHPFSPELTVCAGLDILGGGHFQRVEGVCSNSGTSTAHKLLYRLVQLSFLN